MSSFPKHFWYALVAIVIGVFFSEHDLWYSTYEDFAHGEDNIELLNIQQDFGDLREELLNHMEKEELALAIQ